MTTSAITSEVTALIRASGLGPGELRTRTPAAEPNRGGEAERLVRQREKLLFRIVCRSVARILCASVVLRLNFFTWGSVHTLRASARTMKPDANAPQPEAEPSSCRSAGGGVHAAVAAPRAGALAA